MMGLTLFCEFRGTFATLFQSPLLATEILTAILEDNNLARLYVSIYLKRMWTECCALCSVLLNFSGYFAIFQSPLYAAATLNDILEDNILLLMFQSI